MNVEASSFDLLNPFLLINSTQSASVKFLMFGVLYWKCCIALHTLVLPHLLFSSMYGSVGQSADFSFNIFRKSGISGLLLSKFHISLVLLALYQILGEKQIKFNVCGDEL